MKQLEEYKKVFPEINEKELISIFGKIFSNKFEIKTDDKTIGFGLSSDLKDVTEFQTLFKQGEEPKITFCKFYKNDDERKEFAGGHCYLDCKCYKCKKFMVNYSFSNILTSNFFVKSRGIVEKS